MSHKVGSTAALAIVLIAAGCKGKRQAPEPSPEAAATPAAGSDAPARQPTLIRREAAESVMRAWLDAQNKGDLAAYSALYAPEFRGVRRTGEKRVALDRAGWLADRKRMFRKPMVVVAREVRVAVGAGSAEIRLIQDWSSGNYRDVGPKVLRLVETGGKLLITGEEMLRSTVVGTGALPVASARLALVYNGGLVIASDPDLEWGAGEPSLVKGRIVAQPDHCTEDPPDYEADQGRYWECHNAAPENVTGTYVASQKLGGARALARHWRKKTLALYNAAGERCEATAGSMHLWAELEATQDAVAGGDPSEGAVARQVMEQSNPVVIADLAPSCPGALFARALDLPPPPRWTIAEATGALVGRIDAALARLTDGEVFDADGAAPSVERMVLAPPNAGGRRFAFAAKSGAATCSSRARMAAVWEIKGDRLEMVGEASELSALAAAVDSDGDGVPELIFSDGFLLWRDDGYAALKPIDFPDLVVPCLCECE